MSTKFKTKDILASFPNDDLPIISVGCGMCKREKEMSKIRQIICIDPTTANEDRWTGIKKVMTPNYKNVKELIKEDPSIIGNCHLFIEYPMTDYVTYDFLSIYDLQPIHLVLLTTTTCHSGGLLIHMWLNNNGIKTINKEKTRTQKNMPKLNPNIIKYDLKLKKAYRSPGYGEVLEKKNIFVSGNRLEDKIIERAILSPTDMEYMAQSSIDMGNMTSHKKSIYIIKML
jgi:hypothetical protein